VTKKKSFIALHLIDHRVSNFSDEDDGVERRVLDEEEEGLVDNDLQWRLKRGSVIDDFEP
jgi:hypothetical protein